MKRISSPKNSKGSSASPICSFCLGNINKNRDGKPEELISCTDCGNSGHPTCLKYPPELVVKIKTIRWQCIECKSCCECRKIQEPLFFCDTCDRAFHPTCCKPSMKKVPKGKYSCHLCREEEKAIAEHPQAKKSRSPDRIVRTKTKELSSSETSPTRDGSPPPKALRGLIDGMSRFFTPLTKRKSRLPQGMPEDDEEEDEDAPAMLEKPEKPEKGTRRSKSEKETTTDSSKAVGTKSASQKAAQRILARSRRGRRPLQGLPRGHSQLRGLYDGLSHLFDADTPVRKSKTGVNGVITPTKLQESAAASPMTKVVASPKPTPTAASTPASSKQAQSRGRPKKPPPKPSSRFRRITEFMSPSGKKNSQRALDMPVVTAIDEEVFAEAQRRAAEREDRSDDVESERHPPLIEFGQFELETWYSSPYPREYARLPKLFLCEFCLKYMKSRVVLQRHLCKCGLTHPPADEIYRKGGISVFEVDGNVNRLYCQNLCLLAKLFLDHKTLYYDVEPFLFYVLCTNDETGSHLVGYFSKEKHCTQKYNVSCIMTLPQYQQRGYGRFLIDFSYLLSRVEGQPGSPEKPLSDLGQISYHAYWRSVLLDQLLMRKGSFTVQEVSHATGMTPRDIAWTLQSLGLIRRVTKDKGPRFVVVLSPQLVTDYERKRATKNRIPLDPDALLWTPVVSRVPGASELGTTNDHSRVSVEKASPTRKPEPPKKSTPPVEPSPTAKKRGRKRKRNTGAWYMRQRPKKRAKTTLAPTDTESESDSEQKNPNPPAPGQPTERAVCGGSPSAARPPRPRGRPPKRPLSNTTPQRPEAKKMKRNSSSDDDDDESNTEQRSLTSLPSEEEQTPQPASSMASSGVASPAVPSSAGPPLRDRKDVAEPELISSSDDERPLRDGLRGAAAPPLTPPIPIAAAANSRVIDTMPASAPQPDPIPEQEPEQSTDPSCGIDEALVKEIEQDLAQLEKRESMLCQAQAQAQVQVQVPTPGQVQQADCYPLSPPMRRTMHGSPGIINQHGSPGVVMVQSPLAQSPQTVHSPLNGYPEPRRPPCMVSPKPLSHFTMQQSPHSVQSVSQPPHPPHSTHSSHPPHPPHSTHPTHSPHPPHPTHSAHPTHPPHSTHPAHPPHSTHPAHPPHSTHQSHPPHPAQSHSVPPIMNAPAPQKKAAQPPPQPPPDPVLRYPGYQMLPRGMPPTGAMFLPELDKHKSTAPLSHIDPMMYGVQPGYPVQMQPQLQPWMNTPWVQPQAPSPQLQPWMNNAQQQGNMFPNGPYHWSNSFGFSMANFGRR